MIKNENQKGLASNIARQGGFTLIEILVVIGLIAILAAIVIIAINPARQFAQGRNTQRTSNVNAILNGVGQYLADNKGTMPPALSLSMTAEDIASGNADLCSSLVPTYLPSLPVDPSITSGAVTNCSSSYDTKYTVAVDANGRVTVCAPNGVEGAIPGSTAICVTR